METDKQFAKAFNNGYTLAKYEPALLNTISQNIAKGNFYLEGFFAGKKQLELEISHKHLAELQHLRNKSKIRNRDLEKD